MLSIHGPSLGVSDRLGFGYRNDFFRYDGRLLVEEVNITFRIDPHLTYSTNR